MNEFHPSEIIKDLYISGILAISEKNLQKRNIRFVLNLTYDTSEETFENVRTEKIEIDDLSTVRIYDYFDPYADIIEEYLKKNQGVLVHCMAGVSRSATMCIAFLMKHRGMKLLQAYNHLKDVRPQIRPNPGFFEQLIEYETHLFGENTVNMVKAGESKVPDVYHMEQDSALGYFLPFDKNSDKPLSKKSSNSSIKQSNQGTNADTQRKVIPSSTSPNKARKPRAMRVPSPNMQAIIDGDTSSSEVNIKKTLPSTVVLLSRHDSGSDADDEMSIMSISNAKPLK